MVGGVVITHGPVAQALILAAEGIVGTSSYLVGFSTSDMSREAIQEQINEVIRRFDLESLIKPFTICSSCNGEIVTVSKDLILRQLKSLTKKHYNRFYMCSKCKKIYWEGSHYNRIKDFINSLNHFVI